MTSSGGMGRLARLAATVAADVVFPRTCGGCGVSGSWMCQECASSMPHIEQSRSCQRCGHVSLSTCSTCERCEDWPPFLKACRSIFEHSGSPRNAIHMMKYGGEKARAEWCGMVASGALDALRVASTVLVPVPLHADRLAERGYNQSSEICRWIARQTGLDVRDTLVRVRKTRPQVSLDAQSRRRNTADAFAAREGISGINVILVDDVVTTGATLSSASLALHLAGARTVIALTVTSGT